MMQHRSRSVLFGPRVAAVATLSVLALAVWAGAAACGKQQPAPAATSGDVVARVNGVEITRAALKRVEKFGQFAGSALTDRSAVEQLISEELIREQAARLHVSVSGKELQARVESLAQGVGGVDALQRQLKSGGLVIADLETSLRVVILGEKLQGLMFLSTQATRSQALAYYRSRISLFRQGAAMRLGNIAVRTQKIAEAVAERIEKGQSFANAALQFSTDPEGKDNGGMIGWIDVASIPKPVATALAKLKVGQITEPVSIGGWHIYKLYGRRAASTVPFAQVGEVILKELTRQQRAAALTKWVQEQRTHAKVAILL
jgi:parvulin-like peptidyl-prolyl isomerase